MSLYFDNGQFVSVAKANCPRCHGEGFVLDSKTDEKSVTVTFSICNCIKIKIVTPQGGQEGKP